MDNKLSLSHTYTNTPSLKQQTYKANTLPLALIVVFILIAPEAITESMSAER